MADRSAIEWTDATWNPVTGCSHVSDGCRHCYAETLSLRLGRSKKPWTAQNAAENVVLHPDRLDQPHHWRRPRRVFVNSMSDLFHELVPDDFIGAVFRVMAATPRHTFQILTKRPERMARALGPSGCRFYLAEGPVPCPQPNVWLGVSVEDQGAADERIPLLLETPAAVRFLSVEPLLGPVNLTRALPTHTRGRCVECDAVGQVIGWWCASCGGWKRRIDWVIVGGESGPGFRPMRYEWARSVRDECVASGVPFFFKQWGGRTPKSGGRDLDGRTWDEMPRG